MWDINEAVAAKGHIMDKMSDTDTLVGNIALFIQV